MAVMLGWGQHSGTGGGAHGRMQNTRQERHLRSAEVADARQRDLGGVTENLSQRQVRGSPCRAAFFFLPAVV